MSLIRLYDTAFSGNVSWDTVTKAVSAGYHSGNFNRSNTDIVDAYNIGTTLRKIYHNGTIYATNVDTANTILLKFQYQTASPLNVDIYTYSTVTKTVTHAVNTNSSFIPSSFLKPTTELIDSYYTGAILTQVYHDGAGGITTVTTDTTVNDIVNAFNIGTTMRVSFIDQDSVITNVDTASTIVLWFKTDAGNSLLMNLYTYSLVTKTVSYQQFTNQITRSANFSKPIIELVDSYCAGTTLNEVYHNGDRGINIVVTVNSATCGYVAAAPDIVLTEKIKIKVDDVCRVNPVYLKWRNTLGGWDQWLFSKTQTRKIKTSSIGEYQVNFTDLATQDTISESRGKDAVESMILGADQLTDGDMYGLKELLYSPKVYIVYTDLSQKAVTVSEGSFSWETQDLFHSIEFEISFPKIFTVTQ